MNAVEYRTLSPSFRVPRTAARRTATTVVTISPETVRLAAALARPAAAGSVPSLPRPTFDLDAYYLSERTDFPL